MAALQLQFFAVTALPSTCAKNAIYYVKGVNDSNVSGYITDSAGNPFPVAAPGSSVIATNTTISSSPPSGIPADGDEWIIIPS